ncbi:MAG TPA: hypothetical protein VF033_07560 [Steroidobacteraceae bacterium]|jgi:hypothetical protein
MRIVHSLDELLVLPRDRLVNGFHVRAEVRLDIPDITPPALVRAQASLNELQERGGSFAGAVCMLVTLVYGVVLVLQRHDSPWSWRAGGELAAAAGLSLAIGFAARFAACVHTRWQFARRCRALHRLLAGEGAVCPSGPQGS